MTKEAEGRYCVICNRIIVNTGGRPHYKQNKLCTLCYDSLRKRNLVWLKQKLNNEYKQGIQKALEIIKKLPKTCMNYEGENIECAIIKKFKKEFIQKLNQEKEK